MLSRDSPAFTDLSYYSMWLIHLSLKHTTHTFWIRILPIEIVLKCQNVQFSCGIYYLLSCYADMGETKVIKIHPVHWRGKGWGCKRYTFVSGSKFFAIHFASILNWWTNPWSFEPTEKRKAGLLCFWSHQTFASLLPMHFFSHKHMLRFLWSDLPTPRILPDY